MDLSVVSSTLRGGGWTALLTGLLAAAAAGGCDESFEPLAPGDVHFSVFGYLDAAADTQWIRVMPIRPLMLTSPDSFGIAVSLEHLGSGRVLPLRDSLFRFSRYSDPELGSEGVWLHNFWTTEPIEPGAAYRFTATREGEEPAESLVEVPEAYDVEVWLGQGTSSSDLLRVTGLAHMPFLAAHAHFYDRCGSATDTVRIPAGAAQGDVRTIPVWKPAAPVREGCGAAGVEGRELWIVGSGAEWPSTGGYSPWGLGEPERASNVTNAVGFVGGVLIRTVPYESCTFQGPVAAAPEHCRLRYDGQAATLGGRVDETRCGDGAVDSATVELREIDVEPAAHRKVRTTRTDRRGTFRIGALEAGVRYALKVRAKPEPDPFWGEVDIHTLHHDTLQFTPGEDAELAVELRRLTLCGGAP